MPRLKNANTPRQRSSRACTQCRKRKEKCDGREPCRGCEKRGLDCVFDTKGPISRHSQQPERTSIARTSNLGSQGGSASPVARNHRQVSRQSSSSRNQAEFRREHNEPRLEDDKSEAPVPRDARLLSDGRGQFIYIGDSASVSFVQNVRIIVNSKIGSCDFTNDNDRHYFYEQNVDSDAQVFERFSESAYDYIQPSPYEAEALLNRYLLSTSSVLDLFDRATLFQDFRTWAASITNSNDFRSAAFYLVLAIGAQTGNEFGIDSYADRYFFVARRALLSLGTDQPCLGTIRCYILISLYMLGACRRNASYMNLGTAVRAAYALGLHRADLCRLFPEEERRSRERMWQSLRILDIFLSASLGRPPSTSESVGDMSLQAGLDASTLGTREEKAFFALLHLCSIFESILFEVYQKQEVSTKLADEISKKYREWSSKLSVLLPGPGEEETELDQALESAHVLGMYHWSIILLTRPFLMFRLSSVTNDGHVDGNTLSKPNSDLHSISVFANACVDSAIRCLDIAEDLLRYPMLPKRLPFILNAAFNSALAVGAAFFGDYDHQFPLTSSMDKAEKLLDHMLLSDPQARRYSEIVHHLGNAAKTYVRHRDQRHMEQHSKAKDSIFGNVGQIRPQRDAQYTSKPASQHSSVLNTHPDSSGGSLLGRPTDSQMSLGARIEGRGASNGSNVNPCLSKDVFLSQLTSDADRGGSGVHELNQTNTNYATSPSAIADLFADPYTIPTFTFYGDLDSAASQQPDWRNFVMPMTP